MYPVNQPRRPTGVTILTVLQILIGIVDLLTGLLLLIAGATLTIIGFGMSTAFGFMLIPLAILLFIFGGISFLIAYGLWKGRQWGWISSIIVATIGLALGVLGLIGGDIASVVTIVIEAVILIYLSTYGVRAYFGRVRIPGTYVSSPGQPYFRSANMQTARPFSRGQQTHSFSTCIGCGAPVPYGANFCDRCGTRLR